MKHHKFEKIWVVALTSFLALSGIYYYVLTNDSVEKEPDVYSVILYQNTDNEWETLMDGIEQAEKDYHVKIRYMTLAKSDTAKEQADLILKEATSGVSGIIYAAVNSEGLSKQLKQSGYVPVPMIAVETGMENANTISADNYQMGYNLGKKIIRDMKERQTDEKNLRGNKEEKEEKKVTIISEYMFRKSVKDRYEGLVAAFKTSEENIVINPVKRQKGDFNLSLFIGTTIRNSGGFMVALDKFATEEAAKAWDTYQKIYSESKENLHLYGIGNTAQTVSDLDRELLKALVYQNEFNIGYESVKSLVELQKNEPKTKKINIKHMLVTRETLYEPENERLLFPST